MEIQLRPYQQEFIDNIRNEFANKIKRVVGVAPCGAGKTIMTGWMIREALSRGKRSVFFVHRKELIEQTAKTFYTLGIPFGIISAGTPMNLNLPVQIASVQTLARRLYRFEGGKKKLNQAVVDALHADFLICDECHHILANTYKSVVDVFPKAFLLGVTATPLRMGGITLADSFDSMVETISVNELIKLGNLTPFRYFVPDALTVDLSDVKVVRGDYDNKQLEKVMSSQKVIGDIVGSYKKFAAGKSAICYCVNVEHSQRVACAFNDAGITTAHCDGNTPKILRAKIVDDFRKGEVKVLCNAELFGEGFDVPHCQAVILARPTKSLTLFIQQSMRPLRPDPDDPAKVAVIIDHVHNNEQHGMPNENRVWSLIPPDVKKLVCPSCGKSVVPEIRRVTDGKNSKKVMRRFCPKCGGMFPVERTAPLSVVRFAEDVKGELKEASVDFTVKQEPATHVITKPKTIEEFLLVAKQKNYKPGWAAHKAAAHAKTEADFYHIAKVVGYKPGWAWHQWQERCQA